MQASTNPKVSRMIGVEIKWTTEAPLLSIGRNEPDGVNPSFSVSKYAGVAAAIVWTLAWVCVAILVVERLVTSGKSANALGGIAPIIGIVFGGFMAFWLYPRGAAPQPESGSPSEPWFRRAFGWLGVTGWCVGAVIWNFGVFGALARAAIKGPSLTLVVLLPFSVVGLFLLLFLFTCIALSLDFLFRSDSTRPVVQVIAIPSSKPLEPTTTESSFAKSPILGTLALLSFLNWFAFFGISMYLGGDAVGILPSRDGFVVKSHGHHRAVSEAAWVFSLWYSSATLLLTPLIWLLFGVRQLKGRRMSGKWPLKIFVGLFLVIWFAGWYSGIGSSFIHSQKDWRKHKQQRVLAEPSHQPAAP